MSPTPILGKIKLVKILPESFEQEPIGLKRKNINEVSEERQQNANNVSVGKRNTHIICESFFPGNSSFDFYVNIFGYKIQVTKSRKMNPK